MYTFSSFLRYFLLLINPSHPDPGLREKVELNFSFHTSMWCHKRFHEGPKDLHKTFWGTTKKCEKKNLSLFLFWYNFLKCTGREELRSEKVVFRCGQIYVIEKYPYIVKFCLYCRVWCWNSTIQCQISNSRVTRIANFLYPLPTHVVGQIRNFSSGNFCGILQKPRCHLYSCRLVNFD